MIGGNLRPVVAPARHIEMVVLDGAGDEGMVQGDPGPAPRDVEEGEGKFETFEVIAFCAW